MVWHIIPTCGVSQTINYGIIYTEMACHKKQYFNSLQQIIATLIYWQTFFFFAFIFTLINKKKTTTTIKITNKDMKCLTSENDVFVIS